MREEANDIGKVSAGFESVPNLHPTMPDVLESHSYGLEPYSYAVETGSYGFGLYSYALSQVAYGVGIMFQCVGISL